MSRGLLRSAAYFAAVWLLGLMPAAHAAKRSISTSLWVVSGRTVLMRYTLPQQELRYLVPPGWPAPDVSTVAGYLLKTITVQSAGGACPAIDQGYDIGKVDPLSVAAGLYGYEILFQCQDPRGLSISNGALFDRSAHTDFARIQMAGGAFVPVVFSSATALRLDAPEGARPSGMGTYLRMGTLHVLQDLEGLSFVLAVVLLCRRRPDLLYAAAGLAIGYGIATTLAALNLVVLRPDGNEAWTGFLVACIAALLAARASDAAPVIARFAAGALLLLAATAALMRHGESALLLAGAALFAGGFVRLGGGLVRHPQWWLLPTALFGLVDGFVLAADWHTLQLVDLMPATDLVAFNSGVLLGDLMIGAVLSGALFLLARNRRAASYGALSSDLTAATLAGLGMFWFLSRGFL